MTKKEMYSQIKSNYPLTEDEIAFIDHEIELLSRTRKKTEGMTKKQKENAELAEQVFAFLADSDNAVAASAIYEAFDISSQKLTPIIKALGDKVVKERIKGVTYYTVA